MPHRTGSRFTIHIHNHYSCIPLGRLQSSKFQSAAPFCIHEPEWRSEMGEVWKRNGQHVQVLIQILSSAWLHHAQKRKILIKTFFVIFFYLWHLNCERNVNAPSTTDFRISFSFSILIHHSLSQHLKFDLVFPKQIFPVG